MANPIRFTPKKVDPRVELERRLQAAPIQHAEALLVLFDIIEEAHDQGLLDLVHGAVGSKNEIAAKLAFYAKQPTSVNALRNLIILGEVLGSLDPTVLADTKNEVFDQHEEPPTLWQLFRRAGSRDARRGMAMMLGLVSGLGKSSRTPDNS